MADGETDHKKLFENPQKCYSYWHHKGRFSNINVISKDALTSDNVDGKIRFVCLSDTHSKTDEVLPNLPDGDVLLHCGDFTMLSTEDEIRKFSEFLGKAAVKYKHVVVIPGNHELSFDEATWNQGGLMMSLIHIYFQHSPFKQRLNPSESKELLKNCTLLIDKSVVIMGVKIYGSPWQPRHFNMAFNADRGNEIQKIWENIPNDTDILMTHGPPLGIGDTLHNGKHVGCGNLLIEVQDRIKPKFHVFGHIHEDSGVWRDDNTTFINAANVDGKYNVINMPIVFDYYANNK